MRRLVFNMPLMATVIIALIVTLIAVGRGSDSRNHLASFADMPEPFEIVVTLPFEPEAFHLNRLQGAGRIVGVDGVEVHLRAVKADQLRSLSWRPWITRIAAFTEADQS